MSYKYVYLFSEGDGSMRELLGGKGANLAEMTKLGLPVPQGFTISTEACTQYYEDGRQINDEIQAQIMEYVGKMEEITGKKFGDKENPLLVSVRSGARASMPGMMDTILNLGLNEEVVEVMAKKSGNPRWAYAVSYTHLDVYKRQVFAINLSLEHLGFGVHLLHGLRIGAVQVIDIPADGHGVIALTGSPGFIFIVTAGKAQAHGQGQHTGNGACPNVSHG